MDLRIEVGPQDQVPWFHIVESDGEGVLRITEGHPLDAGVLEFINGLIFGEEQYMLDGVTAPAMSEEVARYINDLILRASTSSHEG